MNDDHLTKEQKAVLRNKSTEAPYTGKYLDNKEDGMYKCADCGAQLFSSETKFDSKSGWPSFDNAIPGAVKEVTDQSHGMIRTEAVCAKCGGHLGHVFEGEGMTDKDTRHCVNSLSIKFIPQDE